MNFRLDIGKKKLVSSTRELINLQTGHWENRLIKSRLDIGKKKLISSTRTYESPDRTCGK